MTLDQATQIREKQLCGHWTAPTRLAEAIAVIRQQKKDTSATQAKRMERAADRAGKWEPKQVLREWVDSTDQKWSVTKSGG